MRGGHPEGLQASLSYQAQLVKNLPAMQETPVRFLGWEDPLKEGMATQSRILDWRIPKDRGAWQATVDAVSTRWTRLSTAQRDLHRREVRREGPIQKSSTGNYA